MKGKMILVLVLALIAVMALAITAYGATSENAQVQVGGRANAKLILTVDNAVVTFPVADPEDTQTISSAFTATVKSNKTYSYEVTAPATFTGGNTPPIGRLQWQRAAGGWNNVTSPVFDNLLGQSQTGNRQYTYDLRLAWQYVDDPDINYTANLLPTAWQ